MPTLEKLHQYHTTHITPLPEYYDPNKLSVIHKGQALNLVTCLDDFLSSSQRVLLVKGQALVGKSSFCHWVSTRVSQSFETVRFTPIYRSLSISKY